MNIIVKTTCGRCYCRPDTTWEREDRDFFAPDSIDSLLYSPVLFARICKAGKCVGKKFAGRYFDSMGYGILLYAGELLDGSPVSYASASCIDHTSVLPSTMSGTDRFAQGGTSGSFILYKEGEEIFSYSDGSADMIGSAISETSALVSLRIGDIVAVELADPALLACRAKEEKPDLGGNGADRYEIRGTFCGNDLFCFNIIF